MGLLAAASLTLLLVVSIRPIRKGAYEVFFYLHFTLVLYVHFIFSLLSGLR